MSGHNYNNNGNFIHQKKPVITTQEIEDIKSKIVELFWNQKQSSNATKDLYKAKLHSVLEKLDAVMKSLD